MDRAVNHDEIQLIAVGTPSDEDGSADLHYVLEVANAIGLHKQCEKIIVDKSTVPVGTGDKVKDTVHDLLEARSTNFT